MSDIVRSRSFRIGKGLRCSFTYRAAARRIECTWEPSAPDGLRGKAWRTYRAARREFLEGIKAHAAAGGGTLVVVETFDLTAGQTADLALALATPAAHA